MALIKCFECNHEFSDFAKACPKCGCPTDIILKKQERILLQVEETKISDIQATNKMDNELIKESNNITTSPNKEEALYKKDNKSRNILITVFSIILIAFIFIVYDNNQVLVEAKNWHDGDGYTIEDQVNGWIKYDTEITKIYGWKSKKIENNTYFISFEFDDDNNSENGYVMYCFEYNRGINLVRIISGNYSLEKKYRELGLIE